MSDLEFYEPTREDAIQAAAAIWRMGGSESVADLSGPLAVALRYVILRLPEEARVAASREEETAERSSTHVGVKRPDWDAYFTRIAEVVSERASCPRASVGAVIVTPDNRVVATGYNGAPAGEPDCLAGGCLIEDGHCQRALHAEVNAVAWAARSGASVDGCRIYVFGRTPCRECLKVLRSAGVTVANVMPRPEPLREETGEAVYTSDGETAEVYECASCKRTDIPANQITEAGGHVIWGELPDHCGPVRPFKPVSAAPVEPLEGEWRRVSELLGHGVWDINHGTHGETVRVPLAVEQAIRADAEERVSYWRHYYNEALSSATAANARAERDRVELVAVKAERDEARAEVERLQAVIDGLPAMVRERPPKPCHQAHLAGASPDECMGKCERRLRASVGESEGEE